MLIARWIMEASKLRRGAIMVEIPINVAYPLHQGGTPREQQILEGRRARVKGMR